MYSNSTVNGQNAFVLPYIIPSSPDHLRPRKENPRKRIVAQYLIRKEDGVLVNVCAKTFRGITQLGQRRINGLSAHFMKTGEAKQEQRGGSRRTQQHVDTTESIVTFIKKFKVSESHYKRRTSARQYLDSTLTLVKLWKAWKAWKAERVAENLPTASKNLFASVFYNRFNLSFKSPKVDVCSYCLEMEKKIEMKIDVSENEAQLRLHLASKEILPTSC